MLRRVAGQCLKRVPLQQRLRLLGVRWPRWCRWPRRLCTLPLRTPRPGAGRDAGAFLTIRVIT